MTPRRLEAVLGRSFAAPRSRLVMKMILLAGAWAVLLGYVLSSGFSGYLQKLVVIQVEPHNLSAQDDRSDALYARTHSATTGDGLTDTGQERPTPFFDANFQPINGLDAWVYSAHFDYVYEEGPLIRIFGLAKATRERRRIYCHVTDSGKVTVIQGRKEWLKDSHGKMYGAVNFKCVIDIKTKPSLVSVTFNATHPPTNQLLIHYPQRAERNFSVCFPALHNFTQAKRLVETIDISRALGADHFFVYNHSVSNATDAVLRRYQKLGLLTVMPWPLPNLDVWYYGQNLAINDCVYRNRFVSRFVVIQDTDELIVPHRHETWMELVYAAENEFLIKSLGEPYKKFVGSFTFESAFYYGAPPGGRAWALIKKNVSMTRAEEAFIVNNSVVPFVHTQRGNIIRFRSRVKTIVRPEFINNAGIHFTHAHKGSATHTVVDNDLGLVHHYKARPNTTVTDSSALRFLRAAMPLLLSSYKELEDVIK
ncbi:unnamed protein product [Lymnaea stagnalis]|uniref:Glycosyltransferase family 92 protein n=1 Tax=Lymnaea stagnalis TaxID=6523 RepID=A0AAV2IS40_LYMST